MNSATTVALLGDSNAAMWSPVFEQIAEQRHWRLETLTRGLCPFLDLPPIIDPTRGQPYTECGRWRDQIIERLHAERPKLVVLAMMRQYGARFGWKLDFNAYDQTWLDSLTRMVKELRGIGTQVLVLGPIPIPPSAVPDCLAAHLDDATACAPTTSKGVDEAGIAAERVAVEAGGGQYADLTGLFCTAERCPVIVGDTLVYMDSWHTTVKYSMALAPAMGTLTDLALARG
ncbi:hypothetical protein C6A85_000000108840 [Mycobacterium sp. ITM-2017-0098]|nr:hypothetical protein C6A85_000000108840 [Mycobacterium sp. ITM-2017-0098]